MDSNNDNKKRIDFFLASVKKNIGKFLAKTHSIWQAILGISKINKKDLGSMKSKPNYDQRLVYSLSKSRIPNFRQLKFLKKFLSNREILIIRGCTLLILFSVITLSARFYAKHLQVVPISGGVYREALVGSIQHLNPLYASVNDVDSDITSLIYSSLFTRAKNGRLVPDLVESFLISDDGLTYTLKLRKDVYWHDGEKLDADDVIFTTAAIKDKKYASPLRLSLLGIKIEKIDDYTVRFVLTQAYPTFFELLTFGIMPEHVWSQVPAESFALAPGNLIPVGSGKYKPQAKAQKQMTGAIARYDLVLNNDYYGEVPKTNLNFYLYSDFNAAVVALNANEVDGISYLPRDLRANIITPKAYNYHNLYLPQQNNLFFNEKNNSALGDKAVRQALAYALNKNEIVNSALAGGAYSIDSPVPVNSFAYNPNIKKYDYNIEEAEKLLLSVDWKINEVTAEQISKAKENIKSEDEDIKKQAEKLLEVGVGKWRIKQENYFVLYLTIADTAEDKLVAEYIKNYWEAIGIKTVFNIVDPAKIESTIIAHRNFEVILYGQSLGNDPDLFSFWHSSQSSSAGLNFSNFSNVEADKLLSEIRLIRDESVLKEKYNRFQDIIAEEVPAIFVYSPIYTYIQSKKLKGFDVQNIQDPKDRFSNIQDWYTQKGKKIVW